MLFIVSILDGETSTNTAQLPPIGKWMITQKGKPADWLGEQYRGKKLFEPINVIIVDGYSENGGVAIEKLITECKRIGYEEEEGHSSGYYGSIDNFLYEQIPDKKRIAFSDGEFYRSNNHGRIMGPAFFNGEYVFIGSFSRESFKITDKIHHVFVSFRIARDNFCSKLNNGPIYKIIGTYNLGNTINDVDSTTADHDGRAIVLKAIE